MVVLFIGNPNLSLFTPSLDHLSILPFTWCASWLVSMISM